MKVMEYLNSNGVHYEMSQHRPAFSAQQMDTEDYLKLADPQVLSFSYHMQ